MEQIQISVERLGLRPVAYGVKAGVSADLLESARVDAAQSAEVELLGPAAGGV